MARKGENIYKRKDGGLKDRYIKNRADEKLQNGYVYEKIYSDTQEQLYAPKACMTCCINTTNIVPSDIIFGDICNNWLLKIGSEVKESTYIKYRNIVNSYIIPNMGSVVLAKVDYILLSEFCTRQLTEGGAQGNGLSYKTVSDILGVIKSIIKYASRNKYSVDSSAYAVTIKLKPPRLTVLSMQEEQWLIENLRPFDDYRDVGILICLFTGIRIGELCALKWSDISLTENIMYVHQTMQRIQTHQGPKKTKILISEPKSQCSVRAIPIPNILSDVLCTVIKYEGYVLTGSNEKYIEPRTMQYYFRNILRQCNIRDTNFHTLRHTFATRCIEAGFDVKSLSEILGHANVNITLNRYVHPSMELKKKNMNMLSELFGVH